MTRQLNNILDRLFKNPLIRRVVKNTSYLFGATGISAGIGMLQGILAARLLGVAGFGILGAITIYASVINKFASFRMSELVVKYVGLYTEQSDRDRAAAVFKAAALTEMLASIFAFTLIWALAPLGAQYLAKDVSLSQWFIVYGLIVLGNLFYESSMGLLQIFNHFRRIAAVNVVQSLVTLSLITLVFITDGGLFEVLLAYLAGKFIGALGITLSALIVATRQWGTGWWNIPLICLKSRARELVNFAVSTYISGSLSLFTKDSELLWVSFFRSPVETGYYKLALALANLVQMPVSPLPQTTYPELSREAARNNWDSFRYLLRQGSLLAGAYTVAATAFLILFGKLIIEYIYKPEFLPAYPALAILLAGFLVANTFYWNRVALLALNRPDFPAIVNFILAVIKVGLIIFLVPQYGFLASAALLAGFYIISVSVNALKTRSIINQNIYSGA
ncbi:MAG: oligosaccharide flippase family protein [Chloroflexota bacterium]|nr:oligosaccharide flippase family protein [Chloroflexota bacterium]